MILSACKAVSKVISACAPCPAESSPGTMRTLGRDPTVPLLAKAGV